MGDSAALEEAGIRNWKTMVYHGQELVQRNSSGAALGRLTMVRRPAVAVLQRWMKERMLVVVVRQSQRPMSSGREQGRDREQAELRRCRYRSRW